MSTETQPEGLGRFLVPNDEQWARFIQHLHREKKRRSTWHYRLRYRLWVWLGQALKI